MTRLLRLLVAAALAVVAVAACSSSDDDPPAAAGSTPAPSATSAPATGTSAPGGGEGTSNAAADGGTITIKDFKYGEPLTVAPGARIEVANQDTARHDVVSDTGEFKTPLLGQGEKATFTAPTRPGTYKFSCSIHPGSMSGIGTLIVQG
ncbi:MAG TPA: cupredoxin domain-containing protein [Mycobacteriales bacterium]|jgi:plastocyanin|nr:cupredoxin domain-containing protein [Mycobacteriales bacterium]